MTLRRWWWWGACLALVVAALGCAGGDDDDDDSNSDIVDDDASDDDDSDDDAGDDDHDVDASDADWTDVGAAVKAGDTIAVTATGTVVLEDGGDAIGPDGAGEACGLSCPAPSLARGALIARIGDAGTPFLVGASFEGPASADGALMMIVNDDTRDDNTGGFDVEVDVEPGDLNNTACDPANFAIQVVAFEEGVLAGFGKNDMPDNVLGPPAGFGEFAPQAGQDELLSLGEGGSIVLKMGREIVDGDGPDFTVFENVLYWSNDETNAYTEAAIVEVSEDGAVWHRFPFDFVADGPVGPGGLPDTVPDNFIGFAGIEPTAANCDPDGDGDFSDAISPVDPAVSGGDLFDLADIGLGVARYVRLIDTGHIDRAPGTETYDDDSDLVSDGGNLLPPFEGIQGFDLDAVAVINGGEPLEPDA